MNLAQKIAAKMRGKTDIPGPIFGVDTRDWVRKPKSQKAVDFAISAGLNDDLEHARKSGFVVGNRWVPEHQRMPLFPQREPGEEG